MPDISKNKFQELAGHLDPLAFLEITEYLASLFQHLKKNIPNYTYFHFSENLGLSYSNVAHLIVRGKRPMTVKAGSKIAQSVGLTGTQRMYFENLVICHAGRKPSDRQKAMRKLFEIKQSVEKSTTARLNLEYLSEWFYPVLREIVLSQSVLADAKELAKMFAPSVRPEQIRSGLKVLEGLGYIEWSEASQCYVSKISRISTGDEVDAVAVIRYHQKMMDLAKESLFRFQENERDISSISFRASEKIFRVMKDEVRAFRKRMLHLAEVDEKTPTEKRIYQLNMQLFPTTVALQSEEES